MEFDEFEYGYLTAIRDLEEYSKGFFPKDTTKKGDWRAANEIRASVQAAVEFLKGRLEERADS